MALCIGTLNAQLAAGSCATVAAADLPASQSPRAKPQAMTSGTAAISAHYAGIALTPDPEPHHSAPADSGGTDGEND